MINDEHHLELAKSLFNHTWHLLLIEGRSADQDAEMVNSAHASAYHWSLVGAPLNHARGEWLNSRVYAVLGRAEPALFHGGHCLRLCEAHDLGPFDLAFAHESMARGYAVAGDDANVKKHLDAARALAESVHDADDRKWLLDELDSVGNDSVEGRSNPVGA